jgi:AcrR family transcriptional regulator
MGIVDRKEKQKTAIRALILDASMKLFVAHGFDNVSIRKIAELIEYSPTTVYLYFKDKNEIFYHLHELGFKHFLDLNRNLEDIHHPLLQLHKMGENYIRFGLENPEFYDIMFIQQGPMEALKQMENADWTNGDAALDRLKKTVEACMQQGLIQPSNVEAVALGIWGMVHGLVSLAIRQRIEKLVAAEHIQATMQQSLNWLLNSISIVNNTAD